MTDVQGKVGKPFWDDRPVAVIGSGPSIKDIDLEKSCAARMCWRSKVRSLVYRGPIVDGIDAARYLKLASTTNLSDLQARVYWAMPQDELGRIEAPPKNVTLLKRDNTNGFTDPGVINGGGSVGWAAMQICIHKRAKHIVLFGFDYTAPDIQPTRDSYALRKHEQEVRSWEMQAEQFALYAPFFTKHGITVANACPASAIRCFQRVDPGDGIAMLRLRSSRKAG